MNKKWFFIYGIALVLLPVLLLLTVRFKSPSEIMTPPSLYGQSASIQKAFENSVSGRSGITLKYPSEGKYRTSFIMADLDSDNMDEAIVFYVRNSEETVVRVNVLDYINEEWESVYDEPGYGSEILSVHFDDLNKDGKKEIICCWSLYGSSTSKVMTIHSTESPKGKPVELKTLVNQSYSFMSVADMDNDNYDEILVIWIDTSDRIPKSYASLLKMNQENAILQVGQNVNLDASVSAYSSFKLQTSGNSSAAFIDAYKGENTMITEILWWDSEKQTLVAPFLDADTLSNLLTIRSPAIPSMDIDNDGNVEIPVNVQSATDTATSQYDELIRVSLTNWVVLNGNSLTEKQYSFINFSAGYSLNVPASLKGNLLAYIQSSTGVLTVYASPDGIERGEPLFSIVLKDKAELTDKDTYTFRKVSNKHVAFGSLTSAGQSAGFTDSMIEDSILFLNTQK